MRDIVEQTPSERDELIYAAWESGKTLRVLARQFETSVVEVERSIDSCLPPFNTQTQMRAYKRAIQKLEDAETKYHAQAMAGDLDSAHVYARINERHCAMQGWSSVNVRLDPYAAQVKEEPSAHEQIRRAIFAVARGNPDYVPKGSGNGAVLAPPTAPSGADDDRENPGSRPQSDTTG